MNRRRLPSPLAAALLAAALALPAAPARASGFLRTQWTGRATAQAGAWLARASDPSAVRYNPAGLVEIEGVELEGGVDFSNYTDTYSSPTAGKFRADHSIQFTPSVYLGWKPAGPWALGIGIDTPAWYRVDWNPVFFPPRSLVRLTDIKLGEVHPVVAYDLGSGWSVGGGIRYVFGTFDQGVTNRVAAPGTGGQLFAGEVLVDAKTDVTGWGVDAGVAYRSTVWGWGATYRDKITVDGGGKVERKVRVAPADPIAAANLENLVRGSTGAHQGLDLPAELGAGIWFAPYPELRVELDLVDTFWSDFSQTAAFSGAPGIATTDVQRSGWDDTLGVRLGLEGDVTDALALSAGFALEPSPVPDHRVDPAFFRGDDTVYSVGASYDFPQISFDVGYSLHNFSERHVTGQEGPSVAALPSTYTARASVWAASARWRF